MLKMSIFDFGSPEIDVYDSPKNDDNIIKFTDDIKSPSTILPPQLSRESGVIEHHDDERNDDDGFAIPIISPNSSIPPISPNRISQIAEMPASPVASELASQILDLPSDNLVAVSFGKGDNDDNGGQNGGQNLDNVYFLTHQEFKDEIMTAVNDDKIESIEEGMNMLKKIYDQGISAIDGNSEAQEAMMKRAHDTFEGLDMDDDFLNSGESMQGGGRGGGARNPRNPRKNSKSNFKRWEEEMMKCGFESFIVSALQFIWIPERIAQQIAWYTAAFFRGVVGVTWGVIKGLFKFIWSNKVGIVLWLLSFANIMNMLKPLYVGGQSAREMVENSWKSSASTNMTYMMKNAGRFEYIHDQMSTGLVETQDLMEGLVDAGMSTSESMTMLNLYNSVQSVVPGGDSMLNPSLYPKIHDHLVDVAKWSEANRGILPGEKLALIGKVVEKYNYYLGGVVSDKIHIIENGVQDAIDIYSHGWKWPAIDRSDWEEIPGHFIPDWIHKGNLDIPVKYESLMPIISALSVFNVLSMFFFIIKSGPLVLDLGHKLWYEMSNVNFTCWSASQSGGGIGVNTPKKGELKKRLKKYLEDFSKGI